MEICLFIYALMKMFHIPFIFLPMCLGGGLVMMSLNPEIVSLHMQIVSFFFLVFEGDIFLVFHTWIILSSILSIILNELLQIVGNSFERKLAILKGKAKSVEVGDCLS